MVYDSPRRSSIKIPQHIGWLSYAISDDVVMICHYYVCKDLETAGDSCLIKGIGKNLLQLVSLKYRQPFMGHRRNEVKKIIFGNWRHSLKDFGRLASERQAFPHINAASR